MARTVASLPAGSRITDYVSLGVVAKAFPLTAIQLVLAKTKKASIRQRDLPAHVVIYYVIALALYMRSSSIPKKRRRRNWRRFITNVGRSKPRSTN